MKTLKRIRYYTANNWNLSTAPAYNLKIYNVVDRELRDKVYAMLEAEDFYFNINELIREFDKQFNYEWQAGFNGRSGGYLVLYKGGKHQDGTVFSYPGKRIEDNEVPSEVMKKFDSLAKNIVKTTENLARNYEVKEESYTVEKTRKVLSPIKK